MTEIYQFSIPRTHDEPNLEFVLEPGDALYMLGANGAGKSSLVSRLFNAHSARSKRISAHRQTWFQSNTLDMTPRSRESLENNIRSQDAQDHARYRLDYGAERAGVAIYDLIDSDTMLARRIADLVRAGDMGGAAEEAQIPAPIQVINEMMRLSNIPIEISIEERQKIVARKEGGPTYSVAELSDGERNAFLVAADVLTAAPSTLLLIDEPERHLHRAIISPLLNLLFAHRKDCAFIVSTHEVMLPLDTPSAATLLVRGCEYAGKSVKAWTVDKLDPGAPIGDDLKSDILGARRKIIFVEGTSTSLDAPLYSLLFPLVSVVSKTDCREVEYAVRGLRGADGLHWVKAWGIVDNDQKPADEISRLQAAGVWALAHYSVEALYYHPKVLSRIAERQAAMIGADRDGLIRRAIEDGVAGAKQQKNHLVTSAILRAARQNVLSGLPKRADVETYGSIKIEVDVASLRAEEEAQFDALTASVDWDGLLSRYPLRESNALDRVVSALKIADRQTYRASVLKLLQDDPEALDDLRAELAGIYAEVME